MSKRNQKRLQLIQMLMIGSELLLLAFVCYWLRNEYLGEKSRLKKDLTVELKDAYKVVTDSVLIEKFVSPVMGKVDSALGNSLNMHSVFLYKDDGTTGELPKQRIKIFRTDSVTKKQIEKRKLQISQELDILDSESISDTGVYVTTSDIDTNEYNKVLQSIYTLFAKEITKDSLARQGLYEVFQDSIKTKFKFEHVINTRGWNFNTDWIAEDSSINNKGLHKIIIELDNTQQMQISGYNWYLTKKISPQILFALLLVLSSAIAFRMTYRSLKNQIRLSELKNGLISNMSHELKTPVSTVKVALEVLDNFDVVNKPDKAREYIHMAMLETHRLELLVNKALNTSLMEQGKMTLERTPINIFNLVEEIIGAMRLRLQQKGATINLASEGNDFVINADKLHIQGAVMNVIDNSMKYGKNDVVIDIKVIAKDASIIIEIGDNGPGIPDKYIEQVFDKFFRIPEGDMHNVKGYGLGLSYVRQVMQMHKGAATIKNKTEGGCLFQLQLFRGR